MISPYGYQPQPIVAWVQGEQGARSHPLPPNSAAFLLDSNPDAHSFYIKTTDQSGMPLPLRAFDYQERVNIEPSEKIDTSSFVTKEDFDLRINELKELIEAKGKRAKE